MRHILISLALLTTVTLQSCLDLGDDDECSLTSEPLDQSDLVTNSANNTFDGNVNYRQVTPLRLNFITGSCNSPTISANWTYTGTYEIISQFPESSSIEVEFVTSGTICSQLSGDGGKSEKICNEVVVNRDNVWGNTSDGFPEERAIQSVTYTLNGDVYSGFGGLRDGSNVWYKFDTVAWQWQEKASIPNVTVFTAFGGFSINGVGYLIGNNSKVYSYNPGTDQWSTIGDFPVNIAEAFNYGSVVVDQYNIPIISESVNGKGYFGMGLSKRLWEFDPDLNTWTELSGWPEAEVPRGALTFSYNDKIYYGSYEYDIATDTWTKNTFMNFDTSQGYSLNLVEFDGLMYGSRNNKTITFDGTTVTEIATTGTSGFEGRGAVTGNFAIFPRPEQSSFGTDVVIYYVRK